VSRKIIKLPGARLTPEVLLGQVLEQATAGKVKAVALVTVDHEGVVRFGWSNMPHHEFAGLAAYLMYEGMKEPDDGEGESSAAS
jgi:hypothetical protein